MPSCHQDVPVVRMHSEHVDPGYIRLKNRVGTNISRRILLTRVCDFHEVDASNGPAMHRHPSYVLYTSVTAILQRQFLPIRNWD